MRRDVELIFSEPGERCRRPGIDEGKLTLVSVNREAGIIILHQESRTSWWGGQNHYCPAGFQVYTFDPERITPLGNREATIWVTTSPQLEFQSKRKSWGDPDAMRALLAR